jgi:hypothetical protein
MKGGRNVMGAAVVVVVVVAAAVGQGWAWLHQDMAVKTRERASKGRKKGGGKGEESERRGGTSGQKHTAARHKESRNVFDVV